MKPSWPGRFRFLLWICGLALLVSFAANFVLMAVIKDFYARELAVRLQAGGGGAAVFPSGNPAGLRVLFLGDSRAASWPPLPADRFLTINAGQRGETTVQIRLRTDSVLTAQSPSVVLLQAGINDLKAIGVYPGAAASITAQCASNITEIVRLCRRHHARVMLSLIIPPGKVSLARRFVWSDQILPAVRSVNEQLIREFEHAEGIDLIDIEKILSSAHSASDATDYLDTLHLAPSAYRKIEPELLRLLDPLAGRKGGSASP